MLYSASLSSCTSRALRASVHRPLSVAARAVRHAARCAPSPRGLRLFAGAASAVPSRACGAGRCRGGISARALGQAVRGGGAPRTVGTHRHARYRSSRRWKASDPARRACACLTYAASTRGAPAAHAHARREASHHQRRQRARARARAPEERRRPPARWRSRGGII
eukprot:scaffold2198_cov353-Prasinococcus_capsulatus_cf.AAC.2